MKEEESCGKTSWRRWFKALEAITQNVTFIANRIEKLELFN